jgi:hypothetical protein
MAASGTTKKITSNQILGAGGTATLASATITGDLTVDTSTLKVDSTNNRVGIGTATPTHALDVTSSATTVIRSLASAGNQAYVSVAGNGGVVGTSSFDLIQDGSSNAFVYNRANTYLAFGTNNSERYRIAADGVATWSNVGGVAGTAMTLNSTGLGLGVTPSAWWSNEKALQIGSGAFFSGRTANPDVAEIGANQFINSSLQRIYIGNGYASRYQQDGGVHQWFTAPSGTAGNAITFTQAMTLDASGNLLVGTTTAGGRLDVQTATGDCAARIKSNAAGSNATLAIDYVNSYGTQVIRKSGTDVWLSGVIADTGATPNYKIQNGSAVGVQLVSGATAWTTLSDETVKDIIEPITNAITKVGSLRSVIGKFKTDSEGTRRSFLIAQDVKSVLPEAVDVVGENNELGLRYTEVIPLLVAAIKELTAEVNALKNA